MQKKIRGGDQLRAAAGSTAAARAWVRTGEAAGGMQLSLEATRLFGEIKRSTCSLQRAQHQVRAQPADVLPPAGTDLPGTLGELHDPPAPCHPTGPQHGAWPGASRAVMDCVGCFCRCRGFEASSILTLETARGTGGRGFLRWEPQPDPCSPLGAPRRREGTADFVPKLNLAERQDGRRKRLSSPA